MKFEIKIERLASELNRYKTSYLHSLNFFHRASKLVDGFVMFGGELLDKMLARLIVDKPILVHLFYCR